jgi:sugar O-acyltransferase (sialic acid O-acetyltransferase NeuD family)
MKLAFVGYGELGKQLEVFAKQLLKPTEIIVFDDNCVAEGLPNAFRFDEYLDDQFTDFAFIIALGYKHLQKKKEIFEALIQQSRNFPSLIHPTAFVAESAIIEDGVYIYPMCNIDKNVTIGLGTLLNNSVTVSHDTQIGACSFLAPAVVTSGFVSMGDCNFIGTGSVISNNIKVGSNVKIGIGSVVNKNIPDNVSAVGNPVRIIKNIVIQ